ncbi:MAG: hypothetical protein N3G22_04740 [Candidatus Micrarchaeota archaeon]|nr:hypothetical protein [Candidatus Micrarchaeota archaeon]
MALSLSDTALIIASALQQGDVHAMRKINDRCIQETTLKFSQHAYLFALISYVLSKVLSKPRYLQQKNFKRMLSSASQLLEQCESSAKKANYERLLALQQRILSTIEKMDEADQRFAKNIIAKGRLKIASILYAKGISLGSAAEMTGADLRELQLYAGQTMMFDRLREERSIEERMKELRKIFSQ